MYNAAGAARLEVHAFAVHNPPGSESLQPAYDGQGLHQSGQVVNESLNLAPFLSMHFYHFS